ncbi:hypothetical protein C5167_029617, partial [Papaver somniferum]
MFSYGFMMVLLWMTDITEEEKYDVGVVDLCGFHGVGDGSVVTSDYDRGQSLGCCPLVKTVASRLLKVFLAEILKLDAVALRHALESIFYSRSWQFPCRWGCFIDHGLGKAETRKNKFGDWIYGSVPYRDICNNNKYFDSIYFSTISKTSWKAKY